MSFEIWDQVRIIDTNKVGTIGEIHIDSSGNKNILVKYTTGSYSWYFEREIELITATTHKLINLEEIIW